MAGTTTRRRASRHVHPLLALVAIGPLSVACSGGAPSPAATSNGASTTTTAIGRASTLPAATTPAVAGTLDAKAVLRQLRVEREHRGGYRRDAFPTWLDLDGNGCDTRDDVLARDSTAAVERRGRCDVVAGSWTDPYSGAVETDARRVQIDHVVSLKEAWGSGAWAWSAERRAAYANDLTDARTLVATAAGSNEAKGDRDPSNWLPARDLCGYVGRWIAIKARWGLSVDESEAGRLRKLLDGSCEGLRISALPPVP